MYLPTLDPKAVQVLEILLQRSNMPGYELLKRASLNFDDVMSAVTTLEKENILQIEGGVSDPSAFEMARFAVRPSAKDVAQFVVRQKR